MVDLRPRAHRSLQDDPHIGRERWRAQHGYTLMEVLIAMVIGVIVSLAAFSFLDFTSADVSRITERVHVTQTGRTAFEKIMLQLHSVCVAGEVNPIQEASGENVISFVSQYGTEASFPTVEQHVITYTPASGPSEGTLTEKTFKSTSAESAGNYQFSTTPASSTPLLTGVRRTVREGKEVPIFQYFRYYRKGDKGPKGETEPPYGEIDPTPVMGELKKEAENIVKVTVSFTVTPTGKESATFNQDRPVAFEDSAVFRLAPPSSAAEHINSPCSEAP
jgi:prepilin-type N-terminal cleavage/methylation domain-containing protein